MSVFSILDEGVVWKNPYPAAQAISALKGVSVQLENGEILHAMQVGQARMSPDAHCMWTRSSDGGRTWSEPVPADIPSASGDSFNTMWPTRLADGRLRALATAHRVATPDDPRYKPDNGGWVGSKGYVTESSDGGRTWSQAQPLDLDSPPGGFSVASSCPVICDSGEWMMVVEPMFTDSVETLHHEAAVMFSRDEGKTWGEKAMMAQDDARRIYYFDPRMARLHDGRYVGIYWTHDTKTDQSLKATINWSEDGHAWSDVQETPFWGSLTLPLVLSDGRLLAVFNHRRNPEGNRVVLSETGGKTWDMDSETVLWDQMARKVTGEAASASEERVRETSLLTEMFSSFDYGCPHPIQLDDGTVLITYYATGLNHIMHQRYVRLEVN